MAFCTNCGAPLPEGAKFCTECGTKVESTAEPEIRNVPDPQPVSEPQTVSDPQPVPDPQPEAPASGIGSAPTVNVGTPGFTFRNEGGSGKKKKNTGLFIAIFAAGAVLVVALVAILVSMLGGTGKASSGSDVLGRYEGAYCLVDGIDMSAEGEWVELKSRGKVRLCLLGDTYNGTWELDGDKLTITQNGDTYSGTLRDGVLEMDFYGLVYTFAKDGAYVPEPVSTQSPATADADWLEGDWYGWWIAQNGTGTWEGIDGSFWDACARVWTYSDGTGYIEIWDQDNEAGECFANADVYFPDGETMVSQEGSFWDMDLADGAWVVWPDDSPMGPEIGNAICIWGTYVDPEDSANSFEYEIYLRPWGTEWEDVRTADTSEMPYDDMMPGYYDSWYLPLIQSGVTEAPDRIGQ